MGIGNFLYLDTSILNWAEHQPGFLPTIMNSLPSVTSLSLATPTLALCQKMVTRTLHLSLLTMLLVTKLVCLILHSDSNHNLISYILKVIVN